MKRLILMVSAILAGLIIVGVLTAFREPDILDFTEIQPYPQSLYFPETDAPILPNEPAPVVKSGKSDLSLWTENHWFQ